MASGKVEAGVGTEKLQYKDVVFARYSGALCNPTTQKDEAGGSRSLPLEASLGLK